MTSRTAPRQREQPRVSQARLVGVFLVAAVVLQALNASTPGRALAIAGALAASVLFRIDQVLIAFLMLTLGVETEADKTFSGLWTSPIQRAGDFFIGPIKASVPAVPIPVSPMFIIAGILLMRAVLARADRARTSPTARLPQAFRQATVLSLAAVAVFSAYGLATGGNVQMAFHQVRTIVIGACICAAVAAVANRALVVQLGAVVLAMGMYRAVLAIYVYVAHVRNSGAVVEYVTAHHDSQLWVVCAAILMAQLVESTLVRNQWVTLLQVAVLLAALILNDRRLSFVALFGAVLYVLLTASQPARQRMRPTMVWLLPVIVVYVVVGYVAPPSKVFAPVQAVKSLTDDRDASNVFREVEDANLRINMRNDLPLPYGFGKEYVRYVPGDDLSRVFPDYLFKPHNSFMAMMLYVGPLGFVALLAPFVLSVRSTHLARRRQPNTLQAHLFAGGVAAWFGMLVQGWGDLGFFDALPVVLTAVLCGAGVASSVAPPAPAPALAPVARRAQAVMS